MARQLNKIPEKIEIDATTENVYDWKAPAMLKVIERLTEIGYTNKEIARILGVSNQTLGTRLKQIPKLEERLLKGRSEATQMMVAAAFEKAIGGRVLTTKKTRINKKGEVEFIIIEQEEAPDQRAQEFWLVNNDPECWKHYRDIIAMNKQQTIGDDTILESDKIARLSQGIFEADTNGTESEHPVPQAASHPTVGGTLDAGDLPTDVQRETADCLQDDVLDVPAETRTEHS